MRREVGSIEEVSPGVWRLRVSIGYSSMTGKRRRPMVTVHGDERAASIALARLMLDAGRLPENDLTVRQYLVDMYLPHVEGRLRKRTVDGYRSKIESHVLETLGDVKLHEVDALRARQVDRQGEGRAADAAPCLPGVVRRAQRRRALAAHRGEPTQGGGRAGGAADCKPDVLTAKEATAFLEACRDHLLEPIVVLALGAGLRRSELAGLRGPISTSTPAW